MKKQALMVCLTVLGCGVPVTGPETASDFVPPEIYREWWKETEECVGVEGNFNRINFFVVPSKTWYVSAIDQDVWGLWIEPHDIFLSHTVVGKKRFVKHEFIHDLTRAGWNDPIYVRCSGIGH